MCVGGGGEGEGFKLFDGDLDSELVTTYVQLALYFSLFLVQTYS